MRIPPLLKLVRPALAPTAAADVLAGAGWAGATDPLRLAAAVGASLCLYTGGMAQNDLCDRGVDRKLAPDRPLVAHPELVPSARLLVAGLFAAGLLLGAFAGVFWHALAVAALASAYNLGLKRYFPLDALTMGGTRAANLGLGLAAGAALAPDYLYALLYGLFIAGVTVASRAEEMGPPPTRRLVLLLSFLVTLPVYAAWGAMLFPRSLTLAVPLALQGWALTRAMRAGTRAAAQGYVLRSLLLIFLLHGFVLWSLDRPTFLIAVLACAAASFFLLGALASRDS